MDGGIANRLSVRIPQLTAQLSHEYDALVAEVNLFARQREEYERKIEGQIADMAFVHQSLEALEKAHESLRASYLEDISRLKAQKDSSGPGPQFIEPKARAWPDGDAAAATNGALPGLRLPDSSLPPLKKAKVGEEEDRSKTDQGLLADLQGAGNQANGSAAGQVSPGGSSTAAAAAAAPVPAPEEWSQVVGEGAAGTLQLTLKHTLVHQSVVCSVVFSNNGKLLATGSDKCANLYDTETGELLGNFVDFGREKRAALRPKNAGSTDSGKDDLYIRSVYFSPDDRFLVGGAEDCGIIVWEIATKSIKHSFWGHLADIYSLVFTHDGNFIVSGSGDKTVKVWDMSTGTCARTIGDSTTGPTDGVTSVTVSPHESPLVAAGSLDRSVCIWRLATGESVARLTGHAASVYSVAFSPDGSHLISGSFDNTVKLWSLGEDLSSPSLVTSFSKHTDFVLSVGFISAEPKGWIFSGSKDRVANFWDPENPNNPALSLIGHKNSVISVACSKVGNLFVTGSGDSKARIWSFTYTKNE